MADDQIQPDRPSRRDDYRRDDPDDRPRRRRRDDEYEDDEDDDYVRRIRRDDGGLNALIPYRNPNALIGYYVGVFSLIPCVGLLLGPAAIILGWLGVRYRNKHPTAGGMGHAITALVLGGLTTVGNWGVLVAGVIAAMMAK